MFINCNSHPTIAREALCFCYFYKSTLVRPYKLLALQIGFPLEFIYIYTKLTKLKHYAIG